MPLKGKGLISELQEDFLRFFSTIPDQEMFYLTGGTALSEFYIGHRLSYDIDMFTNESNIILPFSKDLEEKMKRKFSAIHTVRRTHTFVEFEIRQKSDSIKIQLAYDSPFRFEKPVKTELGVMVNGYKDIIVDKLLSFFGRGEPRDAIDLYFIFKEESLEELVKLASQKDPGFDLYWLSVSFGKVSDFPDDIGRWPIEMCIELSAKDVKDTFRKLAIKTMNKIRESNNNAL